MPARKTKPRRLPPTPADLAALPVRHEHAAGVDGGDLTHWACVGATPDGTDTVREFPAHTPGLRDLVAWLRHCGVTTVALEASGVYGHVLFLTLVEAGFAVVVTGPSFTRQIKGRPKTDRLDCQWIRRLHAHGLLPGVFRPDAATQTLWSYVRRRANLVRLSGQHVRRMQKALGLMNLKPTAVLGDVAGATGLKIIRAVVAGKRDPHAPAGLRDRRCTPKFALEAARRRLELSRARLDELKAGEHPQLLAQCERSVERLAELSRHLRSEASRLEKLSAGNSTSEVERYEAATKSVQAEIAHRERQAELAYLRSKARPEQLAVAGAEARVAEAEVAAAGERLTDAVLTAPFDGVVLRYLKREGEGVTPLMPPDPVALFGDTSRCRVRAEVDERFARRLAVGQRAEVYGRNLGGGPHPGRVVEVEGVMGDKTIFNRSAGERKDLHVVQVVVEIPGEFVAPVGLRVDVRVGLE